MLTEGFKAKAVRPYESSYKSDLSVGANTVSPKNPFALIIYFIYFIRGGNDNVIPNLRR